MVIQPSEHTRINFITSKLDHVEIRVIALQSYRYFDLN